MTRKRRKRWRRNGSAGEKRRHAGKRRTGGDALGGGSEVWRRNCVLRFMDGGKMGDWKHGCSGNERIT